jgi:GTP-binding protein HflX
LHLLTNADVLIEDRLFATLDTTARKLNLPNRQSAILIDTVGFIRKLPHQLVAAFRSTLEEVIYTDVLLHLIDVSSPHAEEEAAATYAVLKELGVERYPIITVLNKIDKIEDPLILYKLRILYPKTYAISAVYGTGSQELLEAMTAELASLRRSITLQIPQSCYALVSELMREGHVLNTEYVGDDLLMEVDIPQRLEHKVKPFVRQKIA